MTAMFWEYDSRIGRRWNVDPVFKPSQSYYSALSNNPISKKDPNGDDDYFNSKGEFIKRQGHGTQIVIQGVAGINKLTDINFKEYKTLSDLYKKVELLSKIATHYGQQIGVEGPVLASVSDESDANTVGNQVNLSVNSTTGRVFSNDYNSVTNSLVHEKGHQSGYLQKRKDKTLDKPITFQEHVEVYMGQMRHSLFAGISQIERIGRVSSAVDYALNGIIKEVGLDARNPYNSKGYAVIDEINTAAAKFHIVVVLNDGEDVKKGYKIKSTDGTRSYDYKDKPDAH